MSEREVYYNVVIKTKNEHYGIKEFNMTGSHPVIASEIAELRKKIILEKSFMWRVDAKTVAYIPFADILEFEVTAQD